MGQLRALQEELRKILFIGGDAEKSRFWEEGLPKRLQVYRNTVHGNAYDTLDSDYKLTKKQFSEDDWFNLSQKYFSKNPPDYWELNNCVLTFPKFLKAQKVKPYIVELAEYELTDLKTFIHTAVPAKGTGRTNPTMATRVFQYQIFDWTVAQCPPQSPPAQKPEVLVFHRDMKHECHIRKADPLELLMLDHFSKKEAHLCDLEKIREELLPQNDVPLNRVLEELTTAGLIS